ncbi:hypothetical protein HK097_005514 [Rhizophlyctis rosea]|uniref:Uncharacterized protein n=1 Tax=Rhizophlyctis rosea TaxID=64517 RepID=A0AAD5S7J0_9FUNG|nr:hypothetical protein HK097_005514 [Rhizophlyctis rosea]
MQMMYVSDTVAKARIVQLQSYIEGILGLPPKISRSPIVMSFFRTDGKHAETGVSGSATAGVGGLNGRRSPSFGRSLEELAQ